MINTYQQRLTRQLDIVPLGILGEQITVIGAGAIGSWTTLALAKMGFASILVYDYDKVDELNMNCQFYPIRDIGTPKVEALAHLVKDFTEVEIIGRCAKYVEGTFPGIVIAAVDNMAVRKTIWENHFKKPYRTKAIIDPRMGAENALLYVMDPKSDRDDKSYRQSLYDDDAAVPEKCTAKSTIYCANMLSGLVVKAVKDVLTSTNYLRTAQWDIAGDTFVGFKNGAEKVSSEQLGIA